LSYLLTYSYTLAGILAKSKYIFTPASTS